ncbi:MAG TPA: hypothetical protein VK179_05425 [Bacteroidales bacterium]|nr:hypothetical protein [Bacteroidales bacterium]
METTINPSLRGVYTLLKYTFAIVPIVAGLDKFTNILTRWDHYLNPALTGMLPFSGHTFMYLVGIIEIIAGILVLIKPVTGTLIVSAWLVLIALSLITGGNYLDVAVRDLVMAISAFSASRLARLIE